jgi:hypothetical protein
MTEPNKRQELLPGHPFANIFRAMNEEELQALIRSMENGYDPRWPITLYEGQILDGRNRQQAALLAGAEPVFETFTGDHEAALLFVVAANLYRRHLSDTEKVFIGVQALLPMWEMVKAEKQKAAGVEGMKGGRPTLGTEKTLEADRPQGLSEGPSRKKRQPQARDEAAKALGVSGRSLARGKRIAVQAPDLVPAVVAGEISMDAAEQVVVKRSADAAKEAKIAAAASAVEALIVRYAMDGWNGWGKTAVEEAAGLLTLLSNAEVDAVIPIIHRLGIPTTEALIMTRNLVTAAPELRALWLALSASDDDRDRTLVDTELLGLKPAIEERQVILIELRVRLEELESRVRKAARLYPEDALAGEYRALADRYHHLADETRTLAEKTKEANLERAKRRLAGAVAITGA